MPDRRHRFLWPHHRQIRSHNCTLDRIHCHRRSRSRKREHRRIHPMNCIVRSPCIRKFRRIRRPRILCRRSLADNHRVPHCCRSHPLHTFRMFRRIRRHRRPFLHMPVHNWTYRPYQGSMNLPNRYHRRPSWRLSGEKEPGTGKGAFGASSFSSGKPLVYVGFDSCEESGQRANV